MVNPLASPFDVEREDVFALEQPQERTAAPQPQRAELPGLIKARQYESPEQALGGLASFVGRTGQQARALTDLRTEAQDFSGMFGDVNKFRQSPRAVEQAFSKETDANIVDYVSKNKIPAFKEVDGQRFYLNTGTAGSIAEVAGEKRKGGGKYEAFGPVGTYSAQWVENPPLSTNPIINFMAAAIPGGQLMLTAAKAADGVKLSPMEIANTLLGGLEMAGVVQPPSVGAMPTGQAGPGIADAGKGLFGKTYAQTQQALKTAAALSEGNIGGVLMAGFGDKIIPEVLERAKVNPETLENLGITPDDFNVALQKTVEAVIDGQDVKDAMLLGFGTYVKEGGSLGFDLPDIDLPSIEGLSAIEDAVREIGSKIDDELFQPIAQSDFVKETLPAFEDTIRETVNPLDDWVDDINLPDFPDLPNIPMEGTTQTTVASPTRTTDSLFNDELFKFKTEIGVDLEPYEYIDLYDNGLEINTLNEPEDLRRARELGLKAYSF